jgi:hypothetical protein
VQSKQPVDRNVDCGFLLDLAQEAILETLAERKVAAGEIPGSRPIGHHRGALKHEYSPAICDHGVNAHKELLLRHRAQASGPLAGAPLARLSRAAIPQYDSSPGGMTA